MPFAGYNNFADCVRKNSGKSDPKAYCAVVMRATEAVSLSSEQRKKWAKQGIAMSDGSYPIPNVRYLEKAIKAYGRSPDEATKSHIIKRARALGRTDLLPDNWRGSTKKAKEEETKPNPITASDVFDASEAVFTRDEETGKMSADVVLIKAGRAKNPRKYRASALEKAASEGVYNGIRMFVDHSEKPPIKRSMTEVAGAVESTTWDPSVKPEGGIRAHVAIFKPDFFDFAQQAKDYIGVSANHRIAVTYAHEGQHTIEDVHSIVGAHSVDWVIYPSAGGEILAFAKESEGADDVDWKEVTLDDLRTHAPQLLEDYKKAIVAEAEQDDDDENDDDKIPTLTKEEIEKLIATGVKEAQEAVQTESRKKEETSKRVRDYLAKSGLPSRVQTRIANAFSGHTEYVESEVKEAVEDAKSELKELGLGGPRITGMGPTGDRQDGERKTVTVRESVEAYFMGPKKEKAAAAGSKES